MGLSTVGKAGPEAEVAYHAKDESVSPLNGQNRNGFTHQPMIRNPRAALCARALLKSHAVATEAVLGQNWSA